MNTSQHPLMALALISLLTSGCAAELNTSAAEPHRDGTLVRGASPALISELEAAPGARVRLLHEKTGLLEVKGLSEEQVQEIVGDRAELSDNLVFEKLAAGAESSGGGRVPTESSFEETCMPGEDAPEAVIDELPRIVRWEQIQDQGVALRAAAVDAQWTVMGPAGPTMKVEELRGPKVVFRPKAPGAYAITLLTKDSRGVCSAKQAMGRFGVTVDAPFKPASGLRAEPATPEIFSHLTAIRAPDGPGAPRGAGATVAVLDSGVNYNHADLNHAILTREGKLVGHDFVMDDELPMDDNGHGTHVAGLIAGARGGLAPQAKLIPIKVLNALGDGELGAIQAGIFYAVDAGAQVLVLSFGSSHPKFRDGLVPALEYAAKHGVLIVAAAGNERRDNELTPYYPASSGASNVISVAAVSSTGELARYSNYGKTSVDLAAPGGDARPGQGLVSASFWPLDADAYSRHSGSSMAAPLVAAAAALVKSVRPGLSPEALKAVLVDSVRKQVSLGHYVRSGGILDVSAALNNLDQ